MEGAILQKNIPICQYAEELAIARVQGEVLSSSIEAGNNISLSGSQQLYLQAADLKAGGGEGDINLTSEAGQIIFDTAVSWDSHSKQTKGRGILFQTNKGGGHSRTTQIDNNLCKET